jgi:hypothetical protein
MRWICALLLIACESAPPSRPQPPPPPRPTAPAHACPFPAEWIDAETWALGSALEARIRAERGSCEPGHVAQRDALVHGPFVLACRDGDCEDFAQLITEAQLDPNECSPQFTPLHGLEFSRAGEKLLITATDRGATDGSALLIHASEIAIALQQGVNDITAVIALLVRPSTWREWLEGVHADLTPVRTAAARLRTPRQMAEDNLLRLATEAREDRSWEGAISWQAVIEVLECLRDGDDAGLNACKELVEARWRVHADEIYELDRTHAEPTPEHREAILLQTELTVVGGMRFAMRNYAEARSTLLR